MKTLIYILSGIALLATMGTFFVTGTPTFGATILQTVQGGTGSTTLSGILIGNGTSPVNTLTIGSNLTLSGTTLSATGGGSGFSTTSASYWITATTSLPSITTLAGLSLPYSQLTGTPRIASSTLLGDTNTFSGTDTFSNTISGSITGNAGTVTNGVYTTTFNGLFDNRLSASSSISGIATLPNLSSINTYSGLVAGNSGKLYQVSTTSMNASITGNAGTAAALASTPTKCSAGFFALGIDASGNAQNCTYAFATTTPWSSGLLAVGSAGTGYTISSSTLFGYTPLNPTRTINTTFPLQGGGDLSADRTLIFGGLSTSTAAVLGNIPYFSGVNTFANVATGTVTCTGNATCGAGSSVLGSNLTINVAAGTAASSTLLGDANTFGGSNTFSSALTYGGVTLSNAVTGTGNMVLSAAPIFTGTLGAPGIRGNTGAGSALQLSGTNASSPTATAGLNFLAKGQSGANGASSVVGFMSAITGYWGFGSSSPFAQVSIHANPINYATIGTTLFAIGSSTTSATTTLFSVSNTGSIFTALGTGCVSAASGVLSASGSCGGSAAQVPTYIVKASGGDFTTIQGALDACGTHGGANIYLLDAAYSIGSTPQVFKGSNCNVYGRDSTTTISFTGATTAFKTNSAAGQYSNNGLHHLVILGDGNASGVAVDMSDMAHATYEDLRIDNVGTCLRINDTQNITFYNKIEKFACTTVVSFGINASSTNPVNANIFENVFIGGSANSIALQMNNGNNNQFIGFRSEPASVTGTVGIKLFDNLLATNDGVFDNIFQNSYLEANGTGLSIAASVNGAGGGVQRNMVLGGIVDANTTDFSIADPTKNTFLNVDNNFGTPISSFQSSLGVATTSPAADFAVHGTSFFDGVARFIGSLVLKIAAAFTPAIEGEIGIDTTDNQLKYFSSGAVRVLSPYANLSFTVASSTWGSGTTTSNQVIAPFAGTAQDIQCKTDTGTMNVQLLVNATKVLPMINASTTANTNTFSSSNTFSRGDILELDMGTAASSPTVNRCTIRNTQTPT